MTVILFGLLAVLLGTLMTRSLQPLAALVALSGLAALWVDPAEREIIVQRWLESRYDQSSVSARLQPKGIIILGGGMAAYRVDFASGASLDTRGRSGRILAAGELARAYPESIIVYAGRGEGPVADNLADLGIERARIVVEDRSGTTYENARNTASLLSPSRDEQWILVTSAAHMPRAVATFQTAGFDVVPFPVDYRSGSARSSTSHDPRFDGQRELLAMAWYCLTGRITPIGLYRSL